MIALLVLLGPPLLAHAAGALQQAGRGLPARLADAEAQYAAARARHLAARRERGAERLLAMEAALRAYRAVEAYWPRAADLRAEAAFRRGGIEAALDRPGRARGAYECVLDAGGDSDWGARARLELAELAEERGEARRARGHYQAVIAAAEASVRWRNRARERLAELHDTQGEWEAVLRITQAWLAEVSSSVEEVRATDLHARALLATGRSTAAKAAVAALLARTATLASRGGEEAAALRRALGRMKAPVALSRGRPRPPP